MQPAEDLDTLTTIAARLARAPIAAIVLAEREGLQLAAQYGLDGRPSNDVLALAALAIRARAPVVIDALLAFPIGDGDGALCVLYLEPPQIADGVIPALASLARHVGGHLSSLRRELRVRTSVAYDLHDSVGQLLAGGRFAAQSLASELDSEHALRAGRIAQLIGDAQHRLRVLSRGLAVFDVAGVSLVDALHALAERTRELHDVACGVIVDPDLREPSVPHRSHAFLVAEEAVSNAVRHGFAHRVDMHLRSSPDGFQLRVADDGRGFSTTPRVDPLSGLGLKTMRYRASLLRGQLSFVTRSPGVEVRLDWPADAAPLTSPP